jgi:hypothetical protein
MIKEVANIVKLKLINTNFTNLRKKAWRSVVNGLSAVESATADSGSSAGTIRINVDDPTPSTLDRTDAGVTRFDSDIAVGRAALETNMDRYSAVMLKKQNQTIQSRKRKQQHIVNLIPVACIPSWSEEACVKQLCVNRSREKNNRRK